MVTARIDVQLNTQTVFGMTVNFGGSQDEAWEYQVAAAVQSAMLGALANVELPSPRAAKQTVELPNAGSAKTPRWEDDNQPRV